MNSAKILLATLLFLTIPVTAQGPSMRTLRVVPLRPTEVSEFMNVTTQQTTYRGHDAMLVQDGAPNAGDDTERVVILKNTAMRDGTIELLMTGDTAPDAPANLRGFVGVAFRVGHNASHFECFYLRPKNGHSQDPVQRGHATQYVSVPGYDWNKLRTETPGKYESAADIYPGVWTRVKIEFAGTTAKLFVTADGQEFSAQPTLTVTDLKQPITDGDVALWVGPGTIAHFSNLIIGHEMHP